MMTLDERIRLYTDRIANDKAEIARTVMRIRVDNDLIPGLMLNLCNMQRDLVELRMMIDERKRTIG